ncbi:MAG: polysaccharide deacetylase family protein [Candidatus Sumerlaeaceae bacterium]|nr:polysaccharide deacetylase family protein [Candidatus Sumerlaeaceae bacterium]
MLTFLKGVLFAGLFALFLVAGFYGFRAYLETHRDGGLFSTVLDVVLQTDRSAAVKATGPKRGGNMDAIVQDYERKKELAKAGASAAATGATTGGDAVPGVAAAGDSKPGQRPIPKPTDKDVVIREWPTGRKWVALTFDDGPHPEYTQKFIELLQSKNAKATFFLIGKQASAFPDLVKQLADAGFEVANHSWSHPQLTRISPEKAREELSKTSQAIADACGAEVTLLRPPYGSTNAKVQALTGELGLRIINWSIDTNDWRSNTTADSMTSEILKNVRDGSIILMHDRHEKSLKTTERVIDKLRAEGYEFVTVSELLGLRDHGQAQPRRDVAQAPPAEAVARAAATAAGQTTVWASAHEGALPSLPVPGLVTAAPAIAAEAVTSASTFAGDILPGIPADKLTVPAPTVR